MISLSIPLTLVDGFNMSWTLPPLLPLCRLVKTFPCVAVFMSSLSLMAIAGDRYRVILCPDRLQVGPRQAWAALPAIFLLSCLLSSFIFFRTNLYSMARVMVRASTLAATFPEIFFFQEISGQMREEYAEFSEQMESIVFCVEVGHQTPDTRHISTG